MLSLGAIVGEQFIAPEGTDTCGGIAKCCYPIYYLNPDVPQVSTCSLKTSDTLWTNVGAVTYSGWQNHAITRF